MKIEVHLLDTATSRRAIFCDESKDADLVAYMYGDGNYACDCNRAEFFNRAIGSREVHADCNEFGNRILVEKIIDVASGKIIYSDKK